MIDVGGEFVRSDLVEDVVGVPVHYEFQILDADTCEPIVGSYFEIFSKNSAISLFYMMMYMI